MGARVDVLQPRIPRHPLPLAAVVLAAVALAGIPIYQYLAIGSGVTEGTTTAYGPTLRLTLDRSDLTATEDLAGSVRVTAPDGASSAGPLLLSIYPAGQPQTDASRVAGLELSLPSALSPGQEVTLPFVMDLSVLPAGAYSVNVELRAQVDKGSVHSVSQTVAVADFSIH